MKRFTCLTPGEFELMEILWPMGEASVKAVWQKVDSSRALAYTTVMTVLEKMHRKGILKQRKKGKAYLYSPALSRDEALKGVLERICEVYFRGSQGEMVRFIKDRFPAQEPGHTAPAPSEAQKPPAG